MRIVVATHNEDRHFYFCNQLIEKTDAVVGVVTGGKVVRRTRSERVRRLLRNGNYAYAARNKVLNTVFRQAGRKYWREKKQTEEKFFGGAADHFSKHHKELLIDQVGPPHRSINAPHYVKQIRALEPDVVAVMGTCLLGKNMVTVAPHVLNMHTGLSPYYRGGQTNLWPIVLGDVGYFGVTIHVMTLGIDSGDIVFTKQPDVDETDTYADINSKCIVLGTELMVDAIRQVGGGTLRTTPQWTSGKLFNNRDMNHYVAHRYFKQRRKFMQRHCELARTNGLPAIRLIPE